MDTNTQTGAFRAERRFRFLLLLLLPDIEAPKRRLLTIGDPNMIEVKPKEKTLCGYSPVRHLVLVPDPRTLGINAGPQDFRNEQMPAFAQLVTRQQKRGLWEEGVIPSSGQNMKIVVYYQGNLLFSQTDYNSGILLKREKKRKMEYAEK